MENFRRKLRKRRWRVPIDTDLLVLLVDQVEVIAKVVLDELVVVELQREQVELIPSHDPEMRIHFWPGTPGSGLLRLPTIFANSISPVLWSGIELNEDLRARARGTTLNVSRAGAAADTPRWAPPTGRAANDMLRRARSCCRDLTSCPAHSRLVRWSCSAPPAPLGDGGRGGGLW